MSRVLLADDSPHAQRMGERILREEGYEVVSVTDGETALVRLADVDPDVIVVDAFLPRRSGFDIARHVKGNPAFQHVSVVMTAGLLEPFSEEEARKAGGDAVLKKPFEATAMLETLRPLAEAARSQRARAGGGAGPGTAAGAPGGGSAAREAAKPPQVRPCAPESLGARPNAADAGRTAPGGVAAGPGAERNRAGSGEAAGTRPAEAARPAGSDPGRPAAGGTTRAEDAGPTDAGAAAQAGSGAAPQAEAARAGAAAVEPERVRAAVALALDAAMPALIDELTERVLAALKP